MTNEENSVHDHEENKSEQELLRREKLKELQDAGRDPFDVYKVEVTHNSKEIKENHEALAGVKIKTAGRLMRKRVQGKAGFSDIHDREGKLQLYLKLDNVGEENLKFFKTLDLGDLISVEGETFITRTGEISLQVTDFQLIAKSLKPLPDKWHGLVDPDVRYRQREVDLLVNPEVRE
ncbi:MAG: lysine--tRNA ligase, partial [Clostridium sp.]|nr:lysine--tRNA ligase [Clostridium sp.]